MRPGTPQPVPNLRLLIWGRSSGRLDATPLPDITTDANGRYTLTDTWRTAFAETVPSSGYMFLCPAYPVHLGAGTWDLPVVQTSWSGDRLPPGVAIPNTSVHGTVTERVGDSGVPVAGATVLLNDGTYDAPATTNAQGFYMTCSYGGTDQNRPITARKMGYQPTTQDTFGGWDFVANFVLARTSS